MTKQSIKRVSNCICFYCICRGARVGLRRSFHRHGCVTAHVSRNSAHDGEGEGRRGLVTVVHRVDYTIFAAGCVDFRGRFPWLRKVSVVRREQIRVLNQNRRVIRRGLSTFQPFNFSTCLTAAQTAAQGAAESSNIPPSIYSKTYTEGSAPFVPILLAYLPTTTWAKNLHYAYSSPELACCRSAPVSPPAQKQPLRGVCPPTD